MNKKQLLDFLNDTIPEKAMFFDIGIEMYAEPKDVETSLNQVWEYKGAEYLHGARIETYMQPSDGKFGIRITVKE